ncbi:MAG: cation:proton antiporter [Chitinophagaceae bacterium]|nr:cation:proton antiporter [Chitinophagaceae bacterium]
MDQQSFLFQALVYLAAAVLLVPFSKKLGLGSVLGYLLAGIIIGPAVLGFVGTEGEDIMHFAEFGVVMMLFLIGLEIDPEKLWKSRGAILGMGGLQVALTTVVAGALTYMIGLDWRSSVALGMIISLSSTAIVMQTLTEKGLLKTRAGQNAFSVLLFQDVAVIPMLAFFPLLSESTGDTNPNHYAGPTLVSALPAWAHTLVVLGSVVVIIFAGRYLVRPLFNLIAKTRLREIFTATALLLIIGIAVLMTEVGLSPALGTFLGGVVLANSEYRHELESDIEPFKGLLLGLFFVAVGASINFSLIFEQPLTIIGIVLAIMVMKAIVLFALAKLSKMTSSQNVLFALSLSQMGEFAFVLLSYTMHEGIISKDISDTMMAVVAISMAITPLLMLLNERILQPWIYAKSQSNGNDKPADQIDERNPVIIAGFGHFGNIIGRFLRAHNIGTTILDTDSDRLELLRKMGFKVYYGDASRYELLHAAGAAHAKLIILALEPPEKRIEVIETIKKHFPDLQMFVRAKNRYDAYDLMNAGMLHVYRETIDTSLRLAVDVMNALGHKADSPERAAKKFLFQDEANLKTLASIRNTEEYIVTARSYIEELEKSLRADMSDGQPV